MTENPFRNRIFPHIEAKKWVKLLDVIAIFDKMRDGSLVLEDSDAVKICLLEHTYPKLRDALGKRKVSHDDKREKGEEIRYTVTGFVYAFMIWILEAIPATHVYVSKEPTEKIPRALAWKTILSFNWSRCRTLFVGDKLAPPLETLTPTKAESETDWWKASFEYFEGNHVQSEAVSEQLEIEKDGLSKQVQKKKRKRGSSESNQDPTYDQLMTTVTTLEGTVATLTNTVSSLHGTIGTLESRLLALEGTIDNLESRLLALEGDEREFGVVSDGDIPAYMSPGPSYTSPASTAHKSLPLANRRKLRVRRTPLKLKSPMRCYSRKFLRCTKPPPGSTTTMSVPMTTTKLLKDTKDAAKDAAKDTHLDVVTTISVPMMTTEDTIHIDASNATAKEIGHTEDELQFIGIEKGDKPKYDFLDLSKIKRNKYPIYSTFEKKKTYCYLDCLPKGITCETSFWDILYPGGEKAEYLEQGNLDGLRPRNAPWTLGLSELVAFHIDSRKLMSMVLVVDALRATIDGTNLRYLSWHKISQVIFLINMDNKHWVAASWNAKRAKVH
ncbi:hypothetical protein Tco_0818242 [Tanacetum coccineum]